MKYYILFMVAMMVFTGVLVSRQPPSGCYVMFDTSRGKNLYRVNAKEVANVYEHEREDKNQAPIKCNWFYCSYPTVKGATLSFRDMRQVRVSDSREQAKEKLASCGKIIK